MATYQFRTSGLQTQQNDPNRQPLILVLCGSFNPITSLHLHLFSSALAYCYTETNFEIIGCYISPVSDHYDKAGLISAKHRLKMAELATEEFAKGGEVKVMVKSWEALQPGYTPIARVLDHFEEEINGGRGAVEMDGGQRRARIALLAGGDLVMDMSTPGGWSEEDLDHIFCRHGVFVVNRTGVDLEGAIGKLGQARVGENIWKVEPLRKNDVSSTKVRLQLKREVSVEDIFSSVSRYIEGHGLYKEEHEGSQERLHSNGEERDEHVRYIRNRKSNN